MGHIVNERTPIGGDMCRWLPIDTAPKDGSEIFLFWYVPGTHEYYFDLGSWNEYLGGWQASDGDVYYPTHWQSPYPIPPANPD